MQKEIYKGYKPHSTCVTHISQTTPASQVAHVSHVTWASHTCDSAHSWWLYSALPFDTRGSIHHNRYPTQSHYPDTEPTTSCSILIMLSASYEATNINFVSQWFDTNRDWTPNLSYWRRPAIYLFGHGVQCITDWILHAMHNINITDSRHWHDPHHGCQWRYFSHIIQVTHIVYIIKTTQSLSELTYVASVT